MEENTILKDLLKRAFDKNKKKRIPLSQTLLRHCVSEGLVKLDEDGRYILSEYGERFIAD